MKLLLDENLSRRLVPFLESTYPGTTQVALVGLESASDERVWCFARDQGYVLVTQDADFHERSVLQGPPPSVIWLRMRNPSKAQVLQCLLSQHRVIALEVDSGKACIEMIPAP